ncbi:MAG: hypothetical protein HYS04_09905, partial [Acidobacteria bacterium]|nr:hypothetical protein [Acidobacteriota bacterium]
MGEWAGIDDAAVIEASEPGPLKVLHLPWACFQSENPSILNDMKVSWFSTCLSALLSTAVFVPSARAGNILLNEGFESGDLSPWFRILTPNRNQCSMTYCEFWNVTSTDSHSGVFSITDVGSMELRQSFAPLPVSDIAGISFWAKDPNALFGVGYELFYSDNPDPALYLNSFLAPLTTSVWTYIDVTPNLTPGKQLVGISISGYDRFPSTPTPRVFVDDITVNVSTPEPQSGYLILIGVVGMLVATRQQRR